MSHHDQQTNLSMSIQVSRVIRSPRERVFDAWVKPEIRRQWWLTGKGDGPTQCDIDARIGGSYCLKQIGGGSEEDTNSEGDEYEWIMNGEFVAFERPRKIAFTWNVNHLHEPLVEQLVTVEFNEVPEGTQVVITHERIPTTRRNSRWLVEAFGNNGGRFGGVTGLATGAA
jgi:uncharacterized protein YndB with AHSA1/START domain